MTIQLSSDYATAWKKWFEEELKKSNLTESYDYSSPDVTDGTMTVVFYGKGTGRRPGVFGKDDGSGGCIEINLPIITTDTCCSDSLIPSVC